MKLYVPSQRHRVPATCVTSTRAWNPLNRPVPPENVTTPESVVEVERDVAERVVVARAVEDEIAVQSVGAGRRGVDDLVPDAIALRLDDWIVQMLAGAEVVVRAVLRHVELAAPRRTGSRQPVTANAPATTTARSKPRVALMLGHVFLLGVTVDRPGLHDPIRLQTGLFERLRDLLGGVGFDQVQTGLVARDQDRAQVANGRSVAEAGEGGRVRVS